MTASKAETAKVLRQYNRRHQGAAAPRQNQQTNRSIRENSRMPRKKKFSVAGVMSRPRRITRDASNRE
jgi:hypothetical protein